MAGTVCHSGSKDLAPSLMELEQNVGFNVKLDIILHPSQSYFTSFPHPLSLLFLHPFLRPKTFTMQSHLKFSCISSIQKHQRLLTCSLLNYDKMEISV